MSKFLRCNFLTKHRRTILTFDFFSMQDIGESFFDAFIFVFSVDDVTTFERAEEAMRRLRHDLGSDRPIILVANKIDLVRNRKVTSEGTFTLFI